MLAKAARSERVCFRLLFKEKKSVMNSGLYQSLQNKNTFRPHFFIEMLSFCIHERDSFNIKFHLYS